MLRKLATYAKTRPCKYLRACQLVRVFRRRCSCSVFVVRRYVRLSFGDRQHATENPPTVSGNVPRHIKGLGTTQWASITNTRDCEPDYGFCTNTDGSSDESDVNNITRRARQYRVGVGFLSRDQFSSLAALFHKLARDVDIAKPNERSHRAPKPKHQHRKPAVREIVFCIVCHCVCAHLICTLSVWFVTSLGSEAALCIAEAALDDCNFNAYARACVAAKSHAAHRIDS